MYYFWSYFILLLIYFVFDSLQIGYYEYANKGISYCASQPPHQQCCANRDDNCVAPIRVRSFESPDVLITHYCYCDYFCDREARGEGNDCCPDFKQVCQEGNLKIPFSTTRQSDLNEEEFGSGEEEITQQTNDEECFENQIAYGYGQTIQRNCQKCTCFGNRWECDENICLIQERLLRQVSENNHQNSWTGKNYTKFWGRTLEDGVRYRLGTLFPEKSVENMNEIFIKQRELPHNFDAREKWARELESVASNDNFDQGDCASSWAFSSTRVAIDRIAILATGSIPQKHSLDAIPPLSVQHLLDCNHKQKGCQAGSLDRAWCLVSSTCYPYISGLTGNSTGICQVPRQTSNSTASLKCPNASANDNRIYKMTPPYRISTREEDIMTEIFTNGPVQATFLVHQDFFMYSGGIYRKLEGLNESAPTGYHSVKILGWGEENVDNEKPPIKYWLCQNWWGRNWGEEGGMFRIVRGENHCEIESFVIAAWAKLDENLNFSGRRKLLRRHRRRRRKRKRLIRKMLI